MSRSLSIRAFLKLQQKRRDGLAPIYINVTIDGDEKSFSLSERTMVSTWDQKRQISTGKSPEDRRMNAKVLQTKGDLNRLFQNIPASELVKSEHLISAVPCAWFRFTFYKGVLRWFSRPDID